MAVHATDTGIKAALTVIIASQDGRKTLRLSTSGPNFFRDNINTNYDSVILRWGPLPQGVGVDNRFEIQIENRGLSIKRAIGDNVTEPLRGATFLQLWHLYDFAGGSFTATQHTKGPKDATWQTDNVFTGKTEGISGIDPSGIVGVVASSDPLRSADIPQKRILDDAIGKRIREAEGRALPVTLGKGDQVARLILPWYDFPVDASFGLGTAYLGMSAQFAPALKGRYENAPDNTELKIYTNEASPRGSTDWTQDVDGSDVEAWLNLQGYPARMYDNSVSYAGPSLGFTDNEGWYYRLVDGGRGPWVKMAFPMATIVDDSSTNSDAEKVLDGRWETYCELDNATGDYITFSPTQPPKIGHLSGESVDGFEAPAGMKIGVLVARPKGEPAATRRLNFELQEWNDTGGTWDQIGASVDVLTVSTGSGFTQHAMSDTVWKDRVTNDAGDAEQNPWIGQHFIGDADGRPYRVKVSVQTSNKVWLVGLCFMFGLSVAEVWRREGMYIDGRSIGENYEGTRPRAGFVDDDGNAYAADGTPL